LSRALAFGSGVRGRIPGVILLSSRSLAFGLGA